MIVIKIKTKFQKKKEATSSLSDALPIIAEQHDSDNNNKKLTMLLKDRAATRGKKKSASAESVES